MISYEYGRGSLGIQVKKEDGTTPSRPPFPNSLALELPMSGFLLLLTLMELRVLASTNLFT